MKAIQFEVSGEPSQVLKCISAGIPEPQHGEVLVKMLASPINPSDLMYIRGRYTVLAQCPARPGFEGVGVVEHSGGGLRGRLFRGRRVVVLNRKGGNWSEYAAVPAEQVIPVSSQLTDEQAATFFVNPATAWVMTQEVLRIPRNAWLLQTAAASSLGRMIVRLGGRCGFRTLNVVRRQAQAEELKALGADHVVVFDGEVHSADVLRDEVQRVTGGAGIQYAVDAVGGETGAAVISCLGRSGHLLLYGTLGNRPLQFSSRTLMTTGSKVEGFWLGNFMENVSLPFKLLLVRRITKLILEGILASEIRATFDLEQASAAVIAAEMPATSGKVLFKAGAIDRK